MSCAKNLDISREEALQGLLGSLGLWHTNSDPSLSPEQLKNLSEKMSEILGDTADRDSAAGNLSSKLLNEDGLPIVDISEPVDEGLQTIISPPPILEQNPISLFSFPPDENERRRGERNRILDLLEEEERLQQLQEERDAEEERKKTIRRRKESAKAELDRLTAVRELHKKMGKSLVRHAKGTDRHEEEACSRSQVPSSVAKKSVSFADAPSVEADESDQQTSMRQPGWGDVTPGKLRAQHALPLLSTAEVQKYPMKMHVVERRPVAISFSPAHKDADSDDESDSPVGHFSENESSEREVESSSSDSCLLDEEPLEEEFDYDTAQHHREVALEYHKKRHIVGAETATLMAACTLDDCEQHETFQSNEQLPVSRFQADRMAKVYNKSHGPVSPAIGQTIIPASSRKTLRNSVRLGKLENDQLVGGGSGESGSEDEAIREVVQMLRTGNIQNVGPDFKPSSRSMATVVPLKHCDDVKPPMVEASTSAHGAKLQGCKLAGGEITATTRSTVLSRSALSHVVERKTPRSTSSFPINRSSSRRPVGDSELPSFDGSASSCTTRIVPPPSN